jgi:hypothetical protein
MLDDGDRLIYDIAMVMIKKLHDAIIMLKGLTEMVVQEIGDWR